LQAAQLVVHVLHVALVSPRPRQAARGSVVAVVEGLRQAGRTLDTRLKGTTKGDIAI
jgi:hypothetical protein